MPRHGLICLIVLFLVAPFSGSAITNPRIFMDSVQFKNFQDGVSLLKANNLIEALSKFKKSNDEGFILRDYSFLFIAMIEKSLGNYDDALDYLKDLEETGNAGSKTEILKIQGEIFLLQNNFAESYKSFINYFKTFPINSRSARSFKDLTLALQNIDLSYEEESGYFDLFVRYIDFGFLSSVKNTEFPFLSDLAEIYLSDSQTIKFYENLNRIQESFDIGRRLLISAEQRPPKILDILSHLGQKLKRYDLKVKILKEALLWEEDALEKARIEFSIGSDYFNIGNEPEAMRFFRRSIKNSGNNFVSVSANYYIGRIYENRGNYKKAAFFYAKAKDAKFKTEEEINFIIKSIFRAGWVNYKAHAPLTAGKYFQTIFDKFGSRLTEDGYAYWLGKSLLKTNQKEEAKKVFQSFYSDFPMSYYGILCALELKNNLDTQVEIKRFSLEDLVDKISPRNEAYIQRAFLLYGLGLYEFAKDEMQMVRPDYRNIRELYVVGILSMLLGDNAKAISLIDYIINQKKGIPNDEIAKIYYPVKYMNFIDHYSEVENVDPYMVISLIRQESVFHEGAISKARAMGLMQIIPSLGLKIAEGLNLGEISEQELLNPSLNLKIGITHFGELMKRFNGNFIYAVAAYNSSETKVKEWMSKNKNLSVFEFLEEIPYFETRKYVKMNVRNYLNYLRLYSDKDWYKAIPY